MRRVRPVVHDLCAELVSEHDRIQRGELEGAACLAARGHELLGVLRGMEIRAADSAGPGFDQYLALTRDGIRKGVHPDRATLHQCCLHAPNSTKLC